MEKIESFSYIFDTSAILAYLANESEANQVKLLKPKAALPFMALSELYYLTWQRLGKGQADHTYALVKSWECPTLYPNERIILTAGRLKAEYKLGIADSYIAAFSVVYGMPLVSKDPDYEALLSEIQLLKLR